MIRYKKALTIMSVLLICLQLVFPMSVYAQEQESTEKLQIEAVGFFSHYPMQQTQLAIEATCEKYADQVELTLYDETQAEGQQFMEKMGLSGHIPMRLYINGSNTVNLDGQEVSFSDFVGNAWTQEDLDLAISQMLEGADIAMDGEAKGSNTGPIIAIVVAVLIIAVIVFLLIKHRKKAAKEKA